MQKNLIIGIVALIVIVIGIALFVSKNNKTSDQNSPENMGGMDISMPGMDHSKM